MPPHLFYSPVGCQASKILLCLFEPMRRARPRFAIALFSVSALLWSAPPTQAKERPYVFVAGSDKHLWVNWWTGSRWRWADQGTPIGATVFRDVGALAIGQRLYAFVVGSDHRLWVNLWDGEIWRWTDL